MNLRPEVIANIISNAVHRGVTDGLQQSVQEAQKPENANNPNILADVVTWYVMNNLNQVLDLNLESLNNEQIETEVPEEPSGAN